MPDSKIRDSPVHQIAYAGPSQQLGAATLLMDVVELAATGIMDLGISVGLFDD